MKNAFIWVPEDCICSRQQLSDALDLSSSIVDSPIFLWNSPIDPHLALDGIKGQFRLILRKSKSQQESTLLRNNLDHIPLHDDILFVCIESTNKITQYMYERAQKENTLNIRWNIVSSDYAKFALIEKQRPLSNYVPRDTQIWIKTLIGTFGKENILECLELIAKSSTVVIGESIIDEYIYCDALGKVSKDPIVAFQKGEGVRQAGGAIATARHFAGLGSETTLFSELDKIDQSLLHLNNDSSSPIDYNLKSSFSSIVKTRYVDSSSGTRVFETYDMPTNHDSAIFYKRLSHFLASRSFERVNFVIMDYGHGLLSDQAVELLLNSNLQLSVNTQSNAGNRGFNSISRYRGAKKAFLNGGEVMLEAKNRNLDLSISVQNLADNLNFEELYVTNGSKGIIAFSNKVGVLRAPAFAPTIVDKVGAGDATLATISALRAVGVPIEIASFYGNIAGALLISSLGNEIYITKELLYEQARSILNSVFN